VHSDLHSDGDGGDRCSGGRTTGKGAHEVRQRLKKAMTHSSEDEEARRRNSYGQGAP
jgi:hypothetical protein